MAVEVLQKTGITWCFEDSQSHTGQLWLLFRLPLRRETATHTALLARVLSAGCEGAASRQVLARRLEELSGAMLEVSVVKKGEEQLLAFRVEAPRLRQRETLDLLRRMATAAVCEEDAFPAAVVDREKAALVRTLASRRDDKTAYAKERATQFLCAGEPFGVDADGYAKDVAGIGPRSLWQCYRRTIGTAPVVALGVGWDRTMAREELEKWLTPRPEATRPRARQKVEVPKAPLRVFDPLPATQAQLVMGWRSRAAFLPLLVCSEVLGGGGSSRLFGSLREGEGLCYSVGSFVYRYPKILIARAGLDPRAADRASESMAKAVAELADTLTDEEVERAKASLLDHYSGLPDTPAALADFLLDQLLNGEPASLEDFSQKLRAVTREDAAEAAATLALDMIYVLAERME